MTSPLPQPIGPTANTPAVQFVRPEELAATRPPEARGLPRDGVRLLAAVGDRIEHAEFSRLGDFLRPGDLLVVNTSATRPAAVDGEIAQQGPVVVHFSTRGDNNSWVVEIRTAPRADKPIRNLAPGTRVTLPDGRSLILLSPEPADQSVAGPRLWRTQPLDPAAVHDLQYRHGRPIRYSYLADEWPLETYQTVFAEPASDQDGSAEMPSAGRPFSADLVTRLTRRGVLFAPVVLHAGVSSQESGEPPAAERFQVPARTASLVNWTRQTGGRVIAVGTTVTRALESAGSEDGLVGGAAGWTTLLLGPDRPTRVVDGLITGMHDPDASHLLLLEAVAGADLVQRAYEIAVDRRYLWHEFGDTTLLLPR